MIINTLAFIGACFVVYACMWGAALGRDYIATCRFERATYIHAVKGRSTRQYLRNVVQRLNAKVTAMSLQRLTRTRAAKTPWHIARSGMS